MSWVVVTARVTASTVDDEIFLETWESIPGTDPPDRHYRCAAYSDARYAIDLAAYVDRVRFVKRARERAGADSGDGG